MSKVWKNCTCLPSCHQIEFTYNEQLNKLDPEELCRENERMDGDAAITQFESEIAYDIIKSGYNSLSYKYFAIKDWLEDSSNDTLESWDRFREVDLAQFRKMSAVSDAYSKYAFGFGFSC